MNTPHFPLEILSLIFCHIQEKSDQYQCALINKQWYNLMNPMLWQEIDAISETNCHSLLHGLLYVELNNRLNIRHQSLDAGHHVRKLSIPGNDLDDNGLLVVARTPLVTDLCIEGETDHSDYLWPTLRRTLALIPPLCPRLTRLTLCGMPVNDHVMKSLGQNCPQLEELEMNIRHASPCDLLQHIVHCPLKTLRLIDNTWLTAAQIASNLRQCNQLSTLLLKDCENTIDILRLLSLPTNNKTCLPLLTTLHLSYYEEDTLLSALVVFLKSHPCIENIYVDFANLDDSFLSIAAIYLQKLQRFVLDSGLGISSSFIRRFIKCCPDLNYMKIGECVLSKRSFPELATTEQTIDADFNTDMIHLIRQAPDPGFTVDDDKNLLRLS